MTNEEEQAKQERTTGTGAAPSRPEPTEGARYEIHIEHASGLAIGDGAQVVHQAAQEKSLRDVELAYLDSLLERYEYWLDHYTPLAGIAEVRAAVQDGPRLDLPMPFIPRGFSKLVEHDFGERAEVKREQVDDLRDAIREHRRIVLLGDPGSGKTTTLWRLAYDYAQAARENEGAPLPVFVPLGGYTDDLEEKERCLEAIVALDPDLGWARRTALEDMRYRQVREN